MPRYPDDTAPFWKYYNNFRYGLVEPDQGFGDFGSVSKIKRVAKILREHGLHPRIYKIKRNSVYDDRWFIYVPDDHGKVELRKAEQVMNQNNLWKSTD